jgi:hypothetical protein
MECRKNTRQRLDKLGAKTNATSAIQELSYCKKNQETCMINIEKKQNAVNDISRNKCCRNGFPRLTMTNNTHNYASKAH